MGYHNDAITELAKGTYNYYMFNISSYCVILELIIDRGEEDRSRPKEVFKMIEERSACDIDLCVTPVTRPLTRLFPTTRKNTVCTFELHACE